MFVPRFVASNPLSAHICMWYMSCTHVGTHDVCIGEALFSANHRMHTAYTMTSPMYLDLVNHSTTFKKKCMYAYCTSSVTKRKTVNVPYVIVIRVTVDNVVCVYNTHKHT